EAARLAPKYVAAHDWLARMYLQDRKPEAALPFAEKAVALTPGVAQRWWRLGRARQGAGDLDGAIMAFQEGLKRDQKHTDCRIDWAPAWKFNAERARIRPPPRELKRYPGSGSAPDRE